MTKTIYFYADCDWREATINITLTQDGKEAIIIRKADMYSPVNSWDALLNAMCTQAFPLSWAQIRDSIHEGRIDLFVQFEYAGSSVTYQISADSVLSGNYVKFVGLPKFN